MAFPTPIRLPGLLGVQPRVSPIAPVGLPTREMFGRIQPVVRTSAPMSEDMSLLQRLLGGAGQVFGGMNDASLSPEQNALARRQAIMQAGLATIAAGSRPGASTLGALAEGAMFGQQAGQQNRAQAYAATQEARVRQALEDPAVTSKLSPQQLAMIRLLPPHQAAEMLTKLAFAPAPEAKVVGDSLVDPITGREIFRAQQEVEIPSELRGVLELSGVDPNTLRSLPPERRKALLDLWASLKRSGAPVTNVVGQTASGMTEAMLREYDKAIAAASDAGSRLESLSVMESLLEQGMTTGRVEDMTMGWRGIGAQLGIADADKLGQQQLFKGIANKLALESKNNMTGPMSDNDIRFLQQQVPQVANTPQGNRLMIEVMRRFAQRQRELALEMDRYGTEHENFRGWLAHKSRWLKQHPVSLEDLYNKPAPFQMRQ